LIVYEPSGPVIPLKWKTPPWNMLKCNIGASWRNDSRTGVVGGQGLKAGNQPNSFCSPIPCDTKDKTRSCAHCYRPSERKTSFFKSREECAAACKA
ncbi:unnamed protein product, partial [Brassica rapa]